MNTPRMLLGLALLFALAPSAAAQCQTSTGPDVIVGAMSGPTNYAAANGVDALSIGTVACNVGTELVSWLGTTNQHPVIGSTLYRYTRQSDGVSRFEQIGMSWLKHGFSVASETLCCASCTITNGRYLGIGCSDPYTSVRNGVQGNLGPRWQVDPHTGVFPYPPASPPFSGTTARRLEVDLADLQTTNGFVRLFAEVMYVTADDAAAGNQDNNASWREVAYDTATGNFTLVGVTQRQLTAIHAWKHVRPAVQLFQVRVPGNGLVTVAYDVTDLGNGLWHYEYALYNMNSSIALRSFRVPVPFGVNVTNIGFHDVKYRNGDGPGNVNFSDVDWVATRNMHDVTWSTETFAQNPSANALRWSTTFNFRFVADRTYSVSTAESELFQDPSLGPIEFPVPVPLAPGVGDAYCSGDGSLATPCPCAPPDFVPSPSGQPFAGCANSAEARGGALRLFGTTNPDTLGARAESMPLSTFVLFLAGDVDVPGGAPFGDGVLCAGGNLARFGEQATGTGSASYPNPNLGLVIPISTHLGVTPGSGATRYLQAIYRNAEAGFCNPSTTNATNAVRVVW